MSIDKLAGRKSWSSFYHHHQHHHYPQKHHDQPNHDPIACQAPFDEIAPTSDQVSATGSQASTWMIDIIQFCIHIIQPYRDYL